MSIRSFTVLALSLRKKRDLDLRPARIHSSRGPRSSSFHVVAHEQTLGLSASRQQYGRPQSAIHPLPADPCRMGCATERTTPACRWRIRRILLQTLVQTGVSVKRHLSRIRPCLTRSLARCLSRALRQLRGSASHYVRPKGFRLSENLFGKTPHSARTKRFSEPSKKAPLGLGSGAHSRRFAQECPE